MADKRELVKDRMKKNQGLPPQGGPAGEPKPKVKPEPVPGAPPRRVLCLCGHEDSNRLCATCRNVRIVKRRDEKLAKWSDKVEMRKQQWEDTNRLPDGALYETNYDAATKTWSGFLKIGEKQFEGHASGIFRLLKDLDAKYRESLKANGGVAPCSPT